METIEMDLMQAQIGELATEVSANKSKIAKIPAIPTPEDTDAGKVIKVSNTGEYELGEAGGGGDDVIFNQFSITNAGFSITAGATASKTYNLTNLNLMPDGYNLVAVIPRSLAKVGSSDYPVCVNVVIRANPPTGPVNQFEITFYNPTATNMTSYNYLNATLIFKKNS